VLYLDPLAETKKRMERPTPKCLVMSELVDELSLLDFILEQLTNGKEVCLVNLIY
jgi:hypothetical protein